MQYDNQMGGGAGIGMAGSTYLKGNQFQESADEENWDQESIESAPEDYNKCEEREEFLFENGARYKGQWKETVRHGYGI